MNDNTPLITMVKLLKRLVITVSHPAEELAVIKNFICFHRDQLDSIQS